MKPSITEPNKTDVFRLLVGSGFTIIEAIPEPNYHLFDVTRTEQLGVKVRYRIAVASGRMSRSDTDWLVRDAARLGAALVLVGDVDQTLTDTAVLTYAQLVDRLGGPMFSVLPLAPEYPARLAVLGDNRLPMGLRGTPDDLFEHYVHAGLQFLFRSRVIRYGQERRGEPVPDGVAIGPSAPLARYDAKAAKGGYAMSMEAVRQFSDYVLDFHKKYESHVGRVDFFLVVSGSFADDEEQLAARARTVQAKCGVPLAFLTAETFGGLVRLLVREPVYRPTLDWGLIFARPVVRLSDAQEQLRSRAKDGVLPRTVV